MRTDGRRAGIERWRRTARAGRTGGLLTGVLIAMGAGARASEPAPPGAPPAIAPERANEPPPPAGPRVPSRAERDGLIRDATNLIARGRTAAARQLLQIHLTAVPNDAQAIFLLGMTHHRERAYARAEAFFVRALELAPAAHVVHHFKAWCHFYQGELDAAETSFEAFDAQVPDDPDTDFGLGLIAMERGDAETARSLIQTAIDGIEALEEAAPERYAARRQDLGKCHARLGELAFGAGELAAARDHLRTALAIDPQQYTAYFVLSQVERRLGNEAAADEAAATYQTILAARDAAERQAAVDAPAAAVDARPLAAGDAGSAVGDRGDAAGDRGGSDGNRGDAEPPALAPMPPVPPNAPPFTMTDVTAASGLDFTTTSGRDPSSLILEVKGGGLALLDHDGDGDLDVFVPNGATIDAPNDGPGARLFENLGGMRFRDATADAGIDLHAWGMGVATGDFDGDGLVDLYVACFGRDRLLAGRPGGRFEDVTEASGIDVPGWSTACSAGDLDGDGDLDLYVASYIDLDLADPPAPSTFRGIPVLAGPRGLPAARDTVLENLGDGRFRDVSDAVAGEGTTDPLVGYGLAAAILDVTGDGRADVFVGNDSQPNRLLEQQPDGTFVDIGFRSGLATSGDGAPRATMGLAIGDMNGDGRPDLFTTNFAGEPNTLHVSAGDGFFDDATSRAALGAASRGVLGWAAAWADLDHDGSEELLVVNGHVYPGATEATMVSAERQPPLLMTRAADGGMRFARVDPSDGRDWLAEPHRDRTLALGDLDGDGDLDAIIGGLNQPLRVLRNDGADGDWLRVVPGERPHGCRIDVERGGRTWTRWIVSGTGYLSADAAEVHVGLGGTSGHDDEHDADSAPSRPSSPADLVRVTWPDGVVVERRAVPVGQRIVITRPR